MQNLPPVQRNHSKTTSLVLANKEYSPGIRYSDRPRLTLIPSNQQQHYGLPIISDESRSMYRSGNNSRAMNYYQPPMDNMAYQAYYPNANMMQPPVDSPYKRMSILSSPRLDHRQSPVFFSQPQPQPQPYYHASSRSQVNTEGEEKNERLLDLIEKQTEVIGHINSKILVQETQKMRREQNDLKLKLKQLELENAIQQKELNAKLMSNYNSLLSPEKPKMPKKPENSPRDSGKSKNSHMIQVMSKLILGQEIPGAFGAESQSHRPRQSKKFDISEHLLKEMYSQSVTKKSATHRAPVYDYEGEYE